MPLKPDPSQAQWDRLPARPRALEEAKARLEAEAAQLRSDNAQLRHLNEGLAAPLQAALLELAELKRQLFGEKSEQLTPEEESQLAEVAADLQEQLQRDPPASEDVLDAEEPTDDESSGEVPQGRRRQSRHPLPEHLQRETVVLEPAAISPGQALPRFPPHARGDG